jgi:hypothetical protein
MAIAIGYEKDIVLSSILRGENEFNFNLNSSQDTKKLKLDRGWGKVTGSTVDIYKK